MAEDKKNEIIEGLVEKCVTVTYDRGSTITRVNVKELTEGNFLIEDMTPTFLGREKAKETIEEEFQGETPEVAVLAFFRERDIRATLAG